MEGMNSRTSLAEISPTVDMLPLRRSEKLALHFVHGSPGITNYQLARLLKMQPRGAQDLLRRLRQRGYIVSHGNGRARKMDLAFRVEQHVLHPDY